MVRVRSEGRSKGCDQCRKRKIKCDGETPVCGQCSKAGKECSGASTGVVFLHATSNSALSRSHKVVHEREHSKAETAGESYGSSRASRQSSVAPSQASSQKELISTPQTPLQPIASNFQPVAAPSTVARKPKPGSVTRRTAPVPPSPSIHIDASRVSTQQFLHNWIERTESGGMNWTPFLPSLINNSPMIERSILASSLASLGLSSNNRDLTTEALKWYGFGLSRQRHQLALIQRKKLTPTIEDVCMPMCLSFFEVTCSTSPHAYFMHCIGASKMLELVGPKGCGSDAFYSLFQTVRAQMMYTSIAMRKPSVFAREEWLTVPFAERPKNPVDWVGDVLILIPRLLCRLDDLQILKSPSMVADEKDALRKEAQKMRDILAATGIEPNQEKGDKTEATSPTDLAAGLKITFFNSAQILLVHILARLTPKPSSYNREIEERCATILYVAGILAGIENVTSAILHTIVLPLTVVLEWSTNTEQRERARALFESWRTVTGIGGTCDYVLLRLKKESEV